LQALALMNNAFVLRMSDRFADRLHQEFSGDLEGQIQRAFQLAYSRAPRPDELALTKHFAENHGLPALCRVLLNANEFLYVD
jgi:hypothetical protein